MNTYALNQIHFNQTADALKDAWNISRVTFKESAEEEFSCESAWSVWQLVPKVFSCFFSSVYIDENKESIEFLFRKFGRRRVLAISERYGLDIADKYIYGMAITRHDVEVIFAAIGDVRKNDLLTVFQEIIGPGNKYLHLSIEETTALKRQFRQRNFSELSRDDLDVLYELAVPIEDIHVLFLKNYPDLEVNTHDKGKTWEGTKKRIRFIEEKRRAEHTRLEGEVRSIKKIYNYYLPKGLVMPSIEGFREVFQSCHGGGVYKFFLKGMHDGVSSQIAYLGTQAFNRIPKPWESLWEDWRYDMAAFGPRVTYYKTKDIIDHGFLRDPDEKIELVGMSLGGAHAERDLRLFFHQVSKICIICNPGLDMDTVEDIKNLSLNRTGNDKLKIELITEEKDITSLFGTAHAGYGCSPENVDISYTILSPIESEEDVGTAVSHRRANVGENFWDNMRAISHALSGPHLEETTSQVFAYHPEERRGLGESYRIRTFSNQPTSRFYVEREEMDDLLDNRLYEWETFRKRFFAWFGSRGNFKIFADRVTPLRV